MTATTLIPSQRPNITDFGDYRVFLKVLFERRKQERNGFSLQRCATGLVVSKTFVKLLLDGKRHLDLDRAPLVAKLFKMSAFEYRYFTLLVCANQSNNAEIKSYFFEMCATLKSTDRNSKEIHPTTSLALNQSNPQGMTIATLNQLPGLHAKSWRQDGFVPRPGSNQTCTLIDSNSVIDNVRTVPLANQLNSITLDHDGALKALSAYEDLRGTLNKLAENSTAPKSIYLAINYFCRAAGSIDTTNL